MTTHVTEEQAFPLSLAVYYRGHAQSLLKDLRATRYSLRSAYTLADQVIESNLSRGERVAGRRRPVLRLSLDQLDRHMQLRKQRTETHRKLVVVNRLIAPLAAGLQRGDNFVPDASQHLQGLVNTVEYYAKLPAFRRFEVDIATQVINQHAVLLREAFERINPPDILVNIASEQPSFSAKDRLLAKILGANLLTQEEKTLLHNVFTA